MEKNYHFLLFILFGFITNLLFSQETNLDWKFHNVGNVLQLITNVGYTANSHTLGLDVKTTVYCEYPIGSGITYNAGESGGGLWIGAQLQGRSLVSTASHEPGYELFPSAEPWDTIWVVGRDEVVDIPYWPNYTGISDQDFVCRYDDYTMDMAYKVSGNEPHQWPLYVEVIQTSHAWTGEHVGDWILHHFYIIPKKYSLENVYIATYWEITIGKFPQTANDDCSGYFPDLHMAWVNDMDSQNDDHGAEGPIGIKVYPPEDIDPQSLTWTYDNVLDPFGDPDEFKYNYMSTGTIFPNTCDMVRGSHHQLISFGPITTLDVGDTLHFMVAQLFGKGEKGMLENSDRLNGLIETNYKLPKPPPNPPLKITSSNHAVTLNWEALEGEVNPETYIDKNRLEYINNPFEGYRVYKSANSIYGPWTLLQEYDVPDNGIQGDIGISREYTDQGLLNNIEYYYTVTSFSKPDRYFPSLETSLSTNAIEVTPGHAAPETVGEVAVVPNPYRTDISYNEYIPPWEKGTGKGNRWVEQDRRIQFINIPTPCEIKIYSLAGDLIQTIQHTNPDRGFADWNLTSRVGQTVASGIYLFSVEDEKNGEIQVGKFVIIK